MNVSAQNVRYQKWNIDPGVCGHPGTWLAESLALFSKPLSCRSHNRKLPATLAPHVSAGSHADKTVNNEPKSQASVQCQSSLARLRVSLWLPKGVGTFGRQSTPLAGNRKLPATLAPHVSAGSHADKTVNNEPKSQASVQCQSSLARLRVSLWLPKGVGTFGRQAPLAGVRGRGQETPRTRRGRRRRRWTSQRARWARVLEARQGRSTSHPHCNTQRHRPRGSSRRRGTSPAR